MSSANHQPWLPSNGWITEVQTSSLKLTLGNIPFHWFIIEDSYVKYALHISVIIYIYIYGLALIYSIPPPTTRETSSLLTSSRWSNSTTIFSSLTVDPRHPVQIELLLLHSRHLTSHSLLPWRPKWRPNLRNYGFPLGKSYERLMRFSLTPRGNLKCYLSPFEGYSPEPPTPKTKNYGCSLMWCLFPGFSWLFDFLHLIAVAAAAAATLAASHVACGVFFRSCAMQTALWRLAVVGNAKPTWREPQKTKALLTCCFSSYRKYIMYSIVQWYYMHHDCTTTWQKHETYVYSHESYVPYL